MDTHSLQPACWLAHLLSLSYLSYTVQDQFPRDGTDHNRLGLFASTRN